MATPPPPPESGRRLGRGLDALLGARKPAPTEPTPPEQTPASESQESLRSIPLGQIRANPFQPRQEFRPEQLADLEASLKVNGLLQPITVRPASSGTGYELIAGERRYRAATRLGWKEIPALVKNVDDRDALSLALVENLQRADLDPIEEAEGYQRLQQEFSATQQQVADAVGKDRSTVANALRLLQLPASVRRLLQDAQISTGHARALLGLTSERAMADLARDAAAQGLSVREVERRVKAGRPGAASAAAGNASGTKAGATPGAPPASSAAAAETRRLEELLRRRLQTQVQIAASGRDRGELRIAFTSNEDLERLLELMGVSFD
jgi:ParB family transcriptional regulator, chromosome partitioning protein